MNEKELENISLSKIVIPLLKGPLFRQKQTKLWEQMLQQQSALDDYLAVMGLSLYLDDAEGYAFLRQQDFKDEANPPPRLIHRRPLSFPVSVLCLLLRQRLLEHDAQGGEPRAIIERRQIREEMSLFLPHAGSDARRDEAVDRYIKRVEDLGLLKPLKDDDQRFEIQRITKALINADWLGDLDKKLREYKNHADSIR